MILFVFEGKDDEPRLYKTLKELFHFSFKEEEILHYFCNNIFSLFDTLKSYVEEKLDETVDLVNVLKEEVAKHKKVNTDLNKIKYSTEVSEIFLFFDYDIRPIDEKNKLSIEEQNKRIFELFQYFENDNQLSERNGIKLYINYPMLESYRYFKLPLPDEKYKEYVFQISDGNFKQKVNDFSDYKNLKYLCYNIKPSGDLKAPENEEINEKIRQNWLHIKEMNIKKAHYICLDDYSIPQNKMEISQKKILENQIKKHINPKGKIAILNALPLFWYEYIDESKID
ncbi:MAG: hypothetical protein IKA80_01510 [Spirochaetaceae bacterium]|nr:hypothetical protein [Spirochaetaceae bacterium]